ncbi:MAG: kelch repeat-containing protein, partial [SAR202 cluster bacterium]|nr:kelch repeat-containing protein [SAR202 cluster bacterium]
NVTVESIDFTPSLTVGFVGASGGQLVYAYPTQATGLAHANQLKYLAPFTGEHVISVSGGGAWHGYTFSIAKATDDAGARAIEPSRYPRLAQSDERAQSEKSLVQDALSDMMADGGLSEIPASANSMNSWSHYPSDEGASALHPMHLDKRTTDFFYCWTSEGTISFQFTSYAVCPTPPPPPGTPYVGMRRSRTGHTATLLPSGDALVAGGADEYGEAFSSVETFESASGKWIETSPMNEARGLHTETLLDDGRLLISGGGTEIGHALASAELYDPADDSWTLTGKMIGPRVYHATAKLSDGKALVTGGFADFERVFETAETFDPVTATWDAISPMSMPRALHTATLLADGRVLVAGGLSSMDNITASAEVFDPASATWTQTGSMSSPRAFHRATLLPDGRALVTGGVSDVRGLTLSPAAAEAYDPATGQWESVSSMKARRFMHTATRMLDGRVLVAGGTEGYDSLPSVEIYEPVADQWSSVESMTDGRAGHTATLLKDGRVIVIGGEGEYGDSVNSSEIYDPTSASWIYMEGSQSAYEETFGGYPAAPAPTPAPVATAAPAALASPTGSTDHPRPAPTLPVSQTQVYASVAQAPREAATAVPSP